MSNIDRDEIGDFKRIDIRLFLPHFGYHPDPASRNEEVFFFEDQSVKVFLGRDGFWRAKNFTSGACMTVIDLAFEVVGSGQWKAACDHLRAIINKPNPSPAAAAGQTSPTSPAQPASVPQSSPSQSTTKIKKGADEVSAEYIACGTEWHTCDSIPSYLSDRGITRIREVFSGSFRVSTSGNLSFLHRSYEDGPERRILRPAGVERRGPNMKGLYTAGGISGVWMTTAHLTFGAKREPGPVVICESQIDALSYDLLNDMPKGTIYLSIRAGAEHHCVELLRFLIDTGRASTVIVATDNDHAGLTYAGRILSGLIVDRKEGEKYYKGVRAYYQAPPGGHEDWNDALRA